MAIDLNKCVGCGACAIACKAENNTDFQNATEKFNWADFFVKTEGTFAGGNLKYTVYPVLCNHCSDAPCVKYCPVTPTAMYKTEDGITMHNDDRCIGCQFCQQACPYSTIEVLSSGEQYSIISYNKEDENVHAFWNETSAVISGGTASPAETVNQSGTFPPFKNEYTHPDYQSVRPSNVTEKCIFCDHRVKNGLDPFCVVSCPAGARVFGDLDDDSSEINQVISAGYKQFKNNLGDFLGEEEQGTQPNVFYVGEFGPVGIRETIAPSRVEKLKVYPNPARESTTVDFELSSKSAVSLALYDITGKNVQQVMHKQEKTVGKHSLQIDLSGLNAGTYIIVLQLADQKMNANLIVTG